MVAVEKPLIRLPIAPVIRRKGSATGSLLRQPPGPGLQLVAEAQPAGHSPPRENAGAVRPGPGVRCWSLTSFSSRTPPLSRRWSTAPGLPDPLGTPLVPGFGRSGAVTHGAPGDQWVLPTGARLVP